MGFRLARTCKTISLMRGVRKDEGGSVMQCGQTESRARKGGILRKSRIPARAEYCGKRHLAKRNPMHARARDVGKQLIGCEVVDFPVRVPSHPNSFIVPSSLYSSLRCPGKNSFLRVQRIFFIFADCFWTERRVGDCGRDFEESPRDELWQIIEN